jgi:hypothetical protein
LRVVERDTRFCEKGRTLRAVQRGGNHETLQSKPGKSPCLRSHSGERRQGDLFRLAWGAHESKTTGTAWRVSRVSALLRESADGQAVGTPKANRRRACPEERRQRDH